MKDRKSNIILEIKNIEKLFERQIGETTIVSIMRIMKNFKETSDDT